MSDRSRSGAAVALVAAVAIFAAMLLSDLGRPLLWNDEAFTAVYAERVLEYGYPRIHGERNVVYALDAPLAVGTKEGNDAYIGSTWGQYYFGALGVLLSRASSDLNGRTALLRLPFALAGVLGLAGFLAALWPLLGERRQLVGATVFVLLCSVSISLILHLREVRYYALVVMFGGALVWLFRRREISRSLAATPYAVGLVVLLLGLFVCYYPAAIAFGVALGVDAALRARREGGGPARLVPLALVAALALPLVWFFEIPAMVKALSANFDGSLGAYAARLRIVALHLLRFEWLAPVLVAKGLLLATRGAAGDDGPGSAERRSFSAFLTLLLVVYWVLVSRTPYFFERYFVLLSPVLVSLAVLDTTRVLDRLRGSWRGPALGLLTATFAASLLVRLPEVSGRLAELREPVQGPLDTVIPYLAQRYPDTEALVIATNYEDPVFAWYLGSQVIVGFNAPARQRDLSLVPDVVMPRRVRHRRDLEHFVARGGYERKTFPILNTPTNNVPSLSPHSAGGQVHRFATARPEGKQPVVLFERIRR